MAGVDFLRARVFERTRGLRDEIRRAVQRFRVAPRKVKPADYRENGYPRPAPPDRFEHILRAAVKAPANQNQAVRFALFRENHRKALVRKIGESQR